MMSPIVVNGDELTFESMFGDRQVTIIEPAVISGSGDVTVANKKVCIVGDEEKVELKATYTTSIYTTMGTGTVTISRLNSDQQASNCTNGAALITKGSKFDALFTPDSPASLPGPPLTVDSKAPSQGKGEFGTAQDFATAGSP
ncbi:MULTISPECIES: hypothetical protein [unclassified Pseudomonas]|uniref:hypothetical protein n=1 Tax=unclassified Pseudomonas TaxID=196821 RepID=UPI000BE4363E|nr:MULTISPECIES: hypothetical protein [unclassified Pseudomonas]